MGGGVVKEFKSISSESTQTREKEESKQGQG
jgi:hypothetical protein